MCIEQEAEALGGSRTNEEGALLYPTELEAAAYGTIGTDYRGDWELQCVVCGMNNAKDITYVHWGRRGCGTGGSEIYDGWVSVHTMWSFAGRY